jgi:hypothetical protein
MKTLNQILFFSSLMLFLSCSEDDNGLDDINNQPKSNVSIKATTSFGDASVRNTSANESVSFDAFYLNIKKIEFEYAFGSGMGDDNQSNDDDQDNYLTFEELPQQIKDYLLENYPNDPFCKAEEEDDSDDPYKYEVELSSGLELYFRADFTLYAVEQDDDPCNGNDDSSDDGSNSFGDDDEFQLSGPFELNLFNNETLTIVNVEIPIGEYEEVEFEMARSNDPSSILYQKSIMITGSIDGIPMTFFHTFEEDFEVDYEDAGQNLVIDESNNNEVIFNFDLNAVVSAVNFESASDGNNDGVIEISPTDSDGNNALANQIKNAIVQYAELID